MPFVRYISLLCVWWCASIPYAAWACSFVPKSLTKDQIAAEAQSAFERASLIVDGELVEPMAMDENGWGAVPAAYLRVIKTWKGKAASETIIVVYRSSCDVSLEEDGQKMRILLLGDGVYWADQGMNSALGGHQADFNAAIDRLVGNERPANFVSFPGAVVLPPVE
jgi:hypothetical protein|tara:strand:+ start:113 stop:610 length:498 start_codon:yes stop_codon:yes gene_type:complete